MLDEELYDDSPGELVVPAVVEKELAEALDAEEKHYRELLEAHIHEYEKENP